MTKKKIKSVEVAAAVAALQPKEPTSIEPIHDMVVDLEAIAQLAETRKLDAINAALMLVRRISSNKCLFILGQLEKEYWENPIPKRP